MKKDYRIYCWIILLFLPFALGIEDCGISEFSGGSKLNSPAEDCFESIPTVTPVPPTPTPTPPGEEIPVEQPSQPVPAPSQPPEPDDNCDNGPGQLLICRGEPVNPPVIILPEPYSITVRIEKSPTSMCSYFAVSPSGTFFIFPGSLTFYESHSGLCSSVEVYIDGSSAPNPWWFVSSEPTYTMTVTGNHIVRFYVW